MHPDKHRLQPGQTVIFIGDHSSPDAPGYVAIVRSILARFHPALGLNLIPAGGAGQTAAGIASQRMNQLLTSARPDWVSLALGLADASREPQLEAQVRLYRERLSASEADEDNSIGTVHLEGRRRSALNGTDPAQPRPESLEWEQTETFGDTLERAIETLQASSIGVILHTPVLVGVDPKHPKNNAARAYARVVRDIAKARDAELVDDLEAFRGVLDRATSYKQQVELADLSGRTNAQGDALLARTFLGTFGLLPYPGQRPPR
jgi:lysophospholipase L1-like esterase